MKHPYLQTGKIVSTHGVHGEVKLLPWADSPEFLLQFHTLYLDGKAYQVEQSRVQKTCVLLKLEGVDTVEAASALRDKVVSIARADAKLRRAVCSSPIFWVFRSTTARRCSARWPRSCPHLRTTCTL